MTSLFPDCCSRPADRVATPVRVVRRVTALTAALASALTLGACATSPDSHYFTLSDSSSSGGGQASALHSSAAPLLIEVLPVNVPSQVSRPQIVTTDGPGKIEVHDYNRWSSPLGDEISAALSQSLSSKLNAIDTYRTPRPEGATVYRITVNVQRFESAPGERATIDAAWSVVRSSDSLTLTCRSSATEQIGSGYPALADGHRRALASIASRIAQGVREEQGHALVPSSTDAPATSTASTNGKAGLAASTTQVTLACPE